MGKYTLGMLEAEMDETSRLILMIADEEEPKDMDLLKFAEEFRKAHPNSTTLTVCHQWEKWHGTEVTRPTHDYKTGAALR